MPTIAFSQHLQTHVDVERSDVSGATVREALDEVIAVNPRLRSYVLDDAGAVRKHIAIFLNGESVHDRTGLSDPLPENGEVVACIPAIPTRRGLSRRRRTSSATRSMASRS